MALFDSWDSPLHGFDLEIHNLCILLKVENLHFCYSREWLVRSYCWILNGACVCLGGPWHWYLDMHKARLLVQLRPHHKPPRPIPPPFGLWWVWWRKDKQTCGMAVPGRVGSSSFCIHAYLWLDVFLLISHAIFVGHMKVIGSRMTCVLAHTVVCLQMLGIEIWGAVGPSQRFATGRKGFSDRVSEWLGRDCVTRPQSPMKKWAVRCGWGKMLAVLRQLVAP